MKTKMMNLLAAFGLAVSGPVASSQKAGPIESPASLRKLDAVAMELMQAYPIPGVAIVGVKNGSVVYMKGFGTSDGSHRFGPDTHFYIASNTKSFTGMAMAALIEQGRIQLDDPITRYVPSDFFPADVDAGKVTIRDLLAHTTGLANDPLVSRTAYTGQVPGDLRSLLRFSQYRNDDHSQSFKYSNLGYVISGMVIKQVTGKDWQQYLADELLPAAGMQRTSTTVPPAAIDTALPFEAGSASPLALRKTDATMHAAGGLYSTLPDMGRWLTLFTDPGQSRIPAAVVGRAATPLVDGLSEGMGPFRQTGYGYGWIHGAVWNSLPLRFHFGSFPGYESMLSYMPDERLGVFVYVNERIGGLRVAATLSNLYYDLMRRDPDADAHLDGLRKMLAAVYAPEPSPALTALDRDALPQLCGNFASDAYGLLTIRNDGDGYLVSMGDLHSQAYRGEGEHQFQVAWIPGNTEVFEASRKDGQVSLAYGDYGTFETDAANPGVNCDAGHRAPSPAG